MTEVKPPDRASQPTPPAFPPRDVASAILNTSLLKNFIPENVENIRDPNRLAKTIIFFSQFQIGSKNQIDKDLFYQNVLDIILNHEKVQQVHYQDQYAAALEKAKDSVEDQIRQGKTLFDIVLPEDKIWRPYDTSSLKESTQKLDQVWTPNAVQLIPVAKIKITDTGHGTGVTHSTQQASNEEVQLQNAANLVNELLTQNRRMDEASLCIIHSVIAEGLTSFRSWSTSQSPIHLGYRTLDAFRDLKLYPPFKSTFSHADYAEMQKRYGLQDIPAQEKAPELTSSPDTEITAGELSKLVPFKAALEKVAPGSGKEEALSKIKGNLELNNLMRKYFVWLNKMTDAMDKAYSGQNQSTPIYKKQEHPAVMFAAQAFNRLINIHPFENGNTRTTSYAIANYILGRYGYPSFILTEENEKPFSDIQRFGEFNTDIFYNVHSADTTEWDKIERADKELAALVTDEIIKAAA